MLPERLERTEQADALRTAARRPRPGSIRSPQAAAAALAAGVALAGAGRAEAQQNIVQTMIPAFYQHQGANTPFESSTPLKTVAIWNPDDGWCAFVSDMDALYPWETLTVAGVKPFDNYFVWLFGAPNDPGKNPGVGAKLTAAGTWLQTADETVIPALVDAYKEGPPPEKQDLTLNNYLTQQKVGPSSLGVFGLVDTQYRTLAAGQVVGQPAGQVQVATIAGWKNVTPDTFQLYQQLTSTGGTLPAALQPLAAITTTIRLNYVGDDSPENLANNKKNTGFWWSFHQVAGAGVAGASTIQYSDPDAIPINAQANDVLPAEIHDGGFTQTDIDNNEYNSAGMAVLGIDQEAGPPPLPGNANYTANNLYGTMVINPLGEITGGNGPYAKGLRGAAAPVTRITNIDAISLTAAQVVNIAVKPFFDVVSFLFSGNFGGDVSQLEIFGNSQLYANNMGLTDTDPDWSISQVMTDPFGNSWASTDGGILLSEGAGGADLMEDGTDYMATEDTTGAVTAWTVFAYDRADGYWLTESYGASVSVGSGAQAVPERPTWLLMLLGFGGAALIALRRGREPRSAAL